MMNRKGGLYRERKGGLHRKKALRAPVAVHENFLGISELVNVLVGEEAADQRDKALRIQRETAKTKNELNAETEALLREANEHLLSRRFMPRR